LSTTTTTLINNIDASFPVAGKNNDSEGFRTNFNLIKTALLAIDSTVTTVVARVGAISATTVNVDAPYVTGTHVSAVGDLTIGGTNVVTTGDNFTTVISANGQSGSIVLAPSTITVLGTGALTDAPTDAYANKFGVNDGSKIKIGATFTYPSAHTAADNVGKINTVTNIDGNNITVQNTATIPLFSVGDSITFTNPFFTGISPGGVPVGAIVMWYGTTVPTGWALCNGSNGTPDLRGMFVVGAGGTYNKGATGGSADAVVVSHSHGITDPGHFHNTQWTNDTPGSKDFMGADEVMTIGTDRVYPTTTSGTNITINSAGVSGTDANLPPYYALYYIMKVS